jgi:hypothetical protein
VTPGLLFKAPPTPTFTLSSYVLSGLASLYKSHEVRSLWQVTDVQTLIVSYDGVVYQKDLCSDSAAKLSFRGRVAFIEFGKGRGKSSTP